MKEIIREHFESIPSTNTWALRHADRLKKEMLIITTADGQTAARGRYNHRWLAPHGLNIYATYSFLIDKSRTDIGNIPQIIALSATHTLRSFKISPRLKWPNDILIQNKKIGGILGETTLVSEPNMLAMALGISININMSTEILASLGRPATSICLETGKQENVELTLNSLTNNFLVDLSQFLKHGFAPFLSSYRQQTTLQEGDPVSFHKNGTLLNGTFKEITEQGTLRLFLSDGTLSEFVSGEITNQKI